MTWLEIILAVAFARWGGGLTTSYHPDEKVAGWAFLLIGLAIAGAAGRHL